MIRHEATVRQIEAATPGVSTWLSANAGSGKTRVLTDRVARLLLDGVEPQNILCLTYTKAAASEMQNRLFKRLGAWAMMPDDKLRADLDELGVPFRPDGQRLRHARTLFARAIETPGGLKIQTIHSFCAGILRRFPLEAGLSPQFREMEDRDAELLQYEVLDDIATGAQVGALDGIGRMIGDQKLIQFVREVIRERDRFQGALDPAAIDMALGLPENATLKDSISVAFIGGEADLVKAIGDLVPGLPASMQKFSKAIAEINCSAATLDDLSRAFKVLLYADGASCSRNFPDSRWKKSVDAFAPVIDDLHAWMDRTAEAWQFQLKLKTRDKTIVLWRFAQLFIDRYDAAKLRRGVVDFDDLIRKTLTLLEDPVLAQWVLFKLDGGIDHILVDEAQDTSPDQWGVITALAREFTAGQGARGDSDRTIFVVGDKKQSIYSFQGADPDGFDRMRAHFEGAFSKIGKPLQTTALSYSFRSSNAILAAVDAVFTGDLRDGLEQDVKHHAFKSDMPGRVDVWPVIDPQPAATPPEWMDPVDMPGPQDHDTLLAEQIAAQIKRMCATETLPVEIGSTGVFARRPITEGDFLILVRRRKRLFSEILRACKAQGLQVAGADKLVLTEDLAVRDILALLRFLALAEDDLSLAVALKSPLFGWGEQTLFGLAHGREKGAFLWQSLRNSTNPDHAQALEVLTDLRNRSDFLRPYDLIERILTRHKGRARLVGRLGEEVEEAIDGLLAQSLTYEQSNVPGLTGFLQWIESDQIAVKRQLDTKGDQIRVMTVHGSKGLEAPIVILPETIKPDTKNRAQTVVSNGHILWKSRAEENPAVLDFAMDDAKAADAREMRRLLYVAMTRAEKWLIVAAAGNTGKEVTDSWYRMVESAMPHLGPIEIDGPTGAPIHRFQVLDWDGLPLSIAQKTTVAPAQWPAFGDAPMPLVRPKTISPSGLGGAKVLPGETETELAETALERGRFIHLLLEVLPVLPKSERQGIARKIFEGAPDIAALTDKEEIIADVLGLLDRADLAHLWGPDALAEVPVSANVAQLGGARISGTIDRLVVTQNTVLVVDFKSNRICPQSPDKVPLGILRQMGAYTAALAQIYPNHAIDPAILWTATGLLMRLPSSVINSAMQDATPS